MIYYGIFLQFFLQRDDWSYSVHKNCTVNAYDCTLMYWNARSQVSANQSFSDDFLV